MDRCGATVAFGRPILPTAMCAHTPSKGATLCTHGPSHGAWPGRARRGGRGTTPLKRILVIYGSRSNRHHFLPNMPDATFSCLGAKSAAPRCPRPVSGCLNSVNGCPGSCLSGQVPLAKAREGAAVAQGGAAVARCSATVACSHDPCQGAHGPSQGAFRTSRGSGPCGGREAPPP